MNFLKQRGLIFKSLKYHKVTLSYQAQYFSSSGKLKQKENKMSDSTLENQDKFLSDIFQLCLKDVIQASRDRSNPVIKFKTPDELLKIIDYDLSSVGTSNETLLNLCQKVVDHSQKTGHPYFFNQMYGGSDPYGFAGNIIVDSLNTNGHTFEVAPVFSVAEKVLLDHMKSFLGFKGDGTFCPGGSYCGLLAMAAARTVKFPNSRQTGLSSLPRLAVFCSEQAHYSAQKNSMVLGIGLDNCHSIKCDDRGKMINEELEKAILDAKNKGAIPFMVIATAGTTVLGAFDDFHKVAELCQEHQMWMHVDCDAFKLWLMWKAAGDQGMAERVEKAWENAEYLLEELKKRPHFKLVVNKIEGPNVCFWYVPPSLRDMPEGDELENKLAEVVPKIKVRLQKSGRLMVGYAPAGSKPTFFRMVLVNENVCFKDIDHLLDEIEREGEAF